MIAGADEVVVDGIRWSRTIHRTPWVTVGDDLADVVATATAGAIRPGDVVVVTEKVAIVAHGVTIPAADVRVSRLARRLAGSVRPRRGSLALSIPEKMQWVIDEVGRPRVLLAAAVSALTRPLGISGAFYLVAGFRARAIDGMRGAYPDELLPPLDRSHARSIAARLARTVGAPVAIVDINDRGGSVRARTSDAPSERVLRRVLADNPLGSRDESTPVAVLRRSPD